MENVLNHYLPLPGVIEKCKDFPYHKKLVRIKANLDFVPGQFVEISLKGIGEFPVSITSAPYEKDYFEICVKKLGRVTQYLENYHEGDVIGFRGPFGNGFPLDVVKQKDVEGRSNGRPVGRVYPLRVPRHPCRLREPPRTGIDHGVGRPHRHG